MIVVSGCPRSGTSLMMDLLRETFGEERIIGEKWPEDNRAKYIRKKRPNETDHEWAVRDYVLEKTGNRRRFEEEVLKTKDMNPNGFWECPWTKFGIQYAEKSPPVESFVKIVSQGLARSNPQYIDKVIYMLRNPRAVAKSQERLRGQFGGLGNPMKGGSEVRVHSPRMFINVTKAAAAWMNKHPEVEVLLVNFDDLIEDPKTQLERVQDFLQEGDFTAAKARIDPELRRSYPEKENEDPLFVPAEGLFEAMKTLDYQAAEAVEIPEPENKPCFCLRLDRRVDKNECNLCRTEPNTRRNYIRNADRASTDWRNLPCVRDCLERSISIEESIENNHWVRSSAVGYVCLRTGVVVNEKHCEACVSDEAFRNQMKAMASAAGIDFEGNPCVYEDGKG